MDAMSDNPSLAECTQDSLMQCLRRAINYGLQLRVGSLGHCYLVPYHTKNKDGKKEKRARLLPSPQGIKDLVRRSCQGRLISDTVYKGDHFEDRGKHLLPVHRPAKNRAARVPENITHAYAAFIHDNGSATVSVWTREECIAHRDRYSEGWRGALKYKTEDQSPWCETHPRFHRMCEKTAIHDLSSAGDLPLEPEKQQFVQQWAAEDAEERSDAQLGMVIEAADVTPTPEPEEPPAPPANKPVPKEERIIERFRECTTTAAVNELHEKFYTHWPDAQDLFKQLADARKAEIRAEAADAAANPSKYDEPPDELFK